MEGMDLVSHLAVEFISLRSTFNTKVSIEQIHHLLHKSSKTILQQFNIYLRIASPNILWNTELFTYLLTLLCPVL